MEVLRVTEVSSAEKDKILGLWVSVLVILIVIESETLFPLVSVTVKVSVSEELPNE